MITSGGATRARLLATNRHQRYRLSRVVSPVLAVRTETSHTDHSPGGTRYNQFEITQEVMMMMMMMRVVVTMMMVLTPSLTTMASPVQDNQIKDNSHWQKLAEFTVRDSDIEVSKYKSEATGQF